MKHIVSKFLTLSLMLSIIFITTGCKPKKKGETIENPLAIVYKNKVPYIINNENKLLSLEQYDSIVPYFGEYLIVKKNNLFGYIKNNGEVLIEPMFNEAYPFSNDMAVVKKGDTSMIINLKNEVLFTLPAGYTSIGYFSEDLLVIANNEKQGYLKYDNTNGSFSYLFDTEDHLKYEYCGQFNNGYAVIGFRNSIGEFRYSHINNKGERLYDLDWEYANDFYCGYAVVGYMGKYDAYEYDTIKGNITGRTREISCMTYYYVSPEGNYLSENNNVLKFVQANRFKDNTAVVSKMYYRIENNSVNYFNNYHLIKNDGTEVCKAASNLKNYFGSGRVCIYDDVFKFGEYYILSYNALQYKALYIEEANCENDSYNDVPVKISTDEEWINTYLEKFTNGRVEAVYVTTRANTFYNLSSFKPLYNNPNVFIAKAQTTSGSKDSCGIIQLTIGENGPIISYFIPPLYDEIIF